MDFLSAEGVFSTFRLVDNPFGYNMAGYKAPTNK